MNREAFEYRGVMIDFGKDRSDFYITAIGQVVEDGFLHSFDINFQAINLLALSGSLGDFRAGITYFHSDVLREIEAEATITSC